MGEKKGRAGVNNGDGTFREPGGLQAKDKIVENPLLGEKAGGGTGASTCPSSFRRGLHGKSPVLWDEEEGNRSLKS